MVVRSNAVPFAGTEGSDAVDHTAELTKLGARDRAQLVVMAYGPGLMVDR